MIEEESEERDQEWCCTRDQRHIDQREVLDDIVGTVHVKHALDHSEGQSHAHLARNCEIGEGLFVHYAKHDETREDRTDHNQLRGCEVRVSEEEHGAEKLLEAQEEHVRAVKEVSEPLLVRRLFLA